MTSRPRHGPGPTGLPGLRATRKAQRITLRELAKQSGIATSTLSHLENSVRDASMPTVRRLTEVLGVGPEVLLRAPGGGNEAKN